MSQIILDFGSGNTCKNDKAYIKRMYDELKAVDTGKHNIVVKWQLFEKAGDNIPLLPEIFDYAYRYGTSLGYKVTSSVFDKNSLDFLLEYDVPFVKIANNRAFDYIIGEIPRKIPIYISAGNCSEYELLCQKLNMNKDAILLCVSQYPTNTERYEMIFGYGSFPDLLLQDSPKNKLYEWPRLALSDHTTNFGLWYRYQPEIIEWHYGLSDSTGLDAGPFMKTPEMLREVI